jgi:SAM-dependent methyltransferase
MAAHAPARGRELRGEKLKAAALRRLRCKETGTAEVTIPAAPSLLAYYKRRLLGVFASLGRPASKEEGEEFGAILAGVMQEAWKESPYSRIIARFQTERNPIDGISYNFESVVVSVGDEYDGWVESRPKPFFGAHANAKALAVARSIGAPREVAVLDVGAAEGRNTIPLAREGFVTDAVELSPELAKLLHENMAKEGLKGRVFLGDVLDPRLEIPKDYYDLVVIAGVIVAHFRNPAHLRQLMERVTGALQTGGLLLFNIFLTLDGYEPDASIRELAELFWTVMFTKAELSAVLEGLPLDLVDDVSYVAYEREHAPESWPPTDYFEAYCEGQDLFDLSAGRAPFEMRWLTYRKR